MAKEWTWGQALAACEAYLGRLYGADNVEGVRADKHGDGWLVAYRRRFKGIDAAPQTERRAAFAYQIEDSPGIVFEWDFICGSKRPRAHRRDVS